MNSLDERIMYKFQHWFVQEKGWFKIMMPLLFILIWINIVTDGLNCDLKNIFQTTCPPKHTVMHQEGIGYCSEDKQCKDICNIWSKTRSGHTLVPLEIDYRCLNGQCECNNSIENCQKSGPICLWQF